MIEAHGLEIQDLVHRVARRTQEVVVVIGLPAGLIDETNVGYPLLEIQRWSK